MNISQAIITKYPDLVDIRVRHIVANQQQKTVSCVISCPNLIDTAIKNDIASIVTQLLPYQFKSKIEWVVDEFDCYNFGRWILETINNKYAILSDISRSCIDVKLVEDKRFLVTMNVNNLQHSLLQQIKFQESIGKILADYSVYKCNIKYIVNKVEDHVIDQLERKQDKLVKLGLSKHLNKPSRYIPIDKLTTIIGGKVVGGAQFITDITQEVSSCVICGSVSDISYKPSKNNAKLYILKFKLTDISESIDVIMFVRHKDTDIEELVFTTGKTTAECKTISDKNKAYNDRVDKKLLAVYSGDSVVVSGKVSASSYSGKLEMVGYKLNKCRILSSSQDLQYVSEPHSEYVVIAPRVLSDNSTQESIFATNTYVPPSLLDDVVIVDINSTGNNIVHDGLVAISCCKMSKGALYSCLTTYINIDKKIDYSDNYGLDIDAKDLIYYPTLTEIIPDIYKYCYNCKIVGNNISDYMEMFNYYAKPHSYRFDNEVIDYMELIASFATNISDNPKLSTLADIAKYCKLDISSQDSTIRGKLLAKCIEILVKHCK